MPLTPWSLQSLVLKTTAFPSADEVANHCFGMALRTAILKCDVSLG